MFGAHVFAATLIRDEANSPFSFVKSATCGAVPDGDRKSKVSHVGIPAPVAFTLQYSFCMPFHRLPSASSMAFAAGNAISSFDLGPDLPLQPDLDNMLREALDSSPDADLPMLDMMGACLDLSGKSPL